MKVTIVTPEGTLFKGEANRISVPGSKGPFEILNHHAPIISSLREGVITYDGPKKGSVDINSGFIEVANNEITICVEAK